MMVCHRIVKIGKSKYKETPPKRNLSPWFRRLKIFTISKSDRINLTLTSPTDQHTSVDPREYAVQAAAGFFARLENDRGRGRPQILVGIFLLAFGYWIGHDHCRLVFLGMKTQGKLVGYQARDLNLNSGGSTFSDTAWMPVIEFHADGQTVRFKDWVGSNFRIPMGGFVQILYDPRHPSNAMIDRPVMNWIPWGPMMGVGTLLLISGLRLRSALRNQTTVPFG